MTEKKWYIVHTYTGHEDKVKAYMEKLISSGEIRDKISNILIPTEEIVEIRKNKKRISKRKFFPGYVLLEMVIDNETYWGVRNIPGVTGFLGGVKPIPLQPEELENIVTIFGRATPVELDFLQVEKI